MDLLRTLLLAGAVLGVAWLVLVAILWLHRPSRDLAGPVLRFIPDVGRLVRDLLRADTTPRSVKVVLWGLFLYLASPIDIVPDVLPVIGSLDDLIISAIVLRWASRRIGIDILRAGWSGSPEGLELLCRFLGLTDPNVGGAAGPTIPR